MSGDFYRAFEEKYRGSHELIKSRLRVYLPFIEPLQSTYNDAKAIDLGCGRGEWLELLKESNFDAQGVDLDDGMLAACRERGLTVATTDALVALRALPDESQIVVSGFHIAEHLPFSDLQTLVQEALRVLRPAGLLILETPNPENIVVGSCSFYLDPTHLRPIPSQLLSFLPEHYGFARTKVLRLQESVNLSDERALSLRDVLGGVSPDYAVVAQKAGDESILVATSQAFESGYGISLEVLVGRYDKQIRDMVHAAEAKALQAETTAHAAEARAQQADDKAQQAIGRATQAETQAQQLHHLLHAVVNSRSWRITAPLRWCQLQLSLLREHGFLARTKALTKKVARPFVLRCISFFDARPSLRNRAVVLAQRLGLYRSLRSVFWRLSGRGYPLQTSAGHPYMPNQPGELSQLTPRAREIYAELKAAIKNKQDSR